MTNADIDQLCESNASGKDSVIRNKRKLNAIVNNAKCVLELDNRSLAEFFKSHLDDGTPLELPAKREETTSDFSHAVAKAMKRHGFQFLGPVSLHSFLQSQGFIMAHHVHCFRHPSNIAAAENSRPAAAPPSHVRNVRASQSVRTVSGRKRKAAKSSTAQDSPRRRGPRQRGTRP